MKTSKFIGITAFALCGAMGIQAQTTYEAANLLGDDLDGTARFVGMGGAMSALGADISTMSTNPAGIGVYRSCDLMMSFGGNGIFQKATYQNNRDMNAKFSGSFDNIGIVFADKVSNEGILRFFNYGFNFHKAKNFNQRMGMQGNLNGLSQTGQMAQQAYDNMEVTSADFNENNENGFFKHNYYADSWVGWLTLLGADSRLIDASALENGSYYPSKSCDYTSRESGGIDQYDFNMAFNFADVVYLGATLSYYDVNYNLYTLYNERFDGGDYQLKNWYKTKGHGIDLKIGAILRPIDYSSLKIGISASTPTLYTLTDYNSAFISAAYNNADGSQTFYEMDTFSDDAYGGDCYTEYTAITPAKVNVSLGYTIGTSVAVGAEYEYQDYSMTKLYDGNGNANNVINNHTESNLTERHTLRLGLEKMFYNSLYARVGFNYMTSGYATNAWKMIPINSVQTNTDYKNIRSTRNITGGLGYRGDVFYADVALLYSNQQSDFYPFDNTQLEATRLTRAYWKGLMTLGLRF